MDMLDDDFFDLDEDLLNATGYFGQNEEIGKIKRKIHGQEYGKYRTHSNATNSNEN